MSKTEDNLLFAIAIAIMLAFVVGMYFIGVDEQEIESAEEEARDRMSCATSHYC
jgi:hypothetical protein